MSVEIHRMEIICTQSITNDELESFYKMFTYANEIICVNERIFVWPALLDSVHVFGYVKTY